jgi:hypothetical protein
MTRRKDPKDVLLAMPIAERVDLVRKIALRSHKDAIDLGACRVLVETIPRTYFTDPVAVQAARQVDRALIERILVVTESALGVIKRHSDRHARVAMFLLEDPGVYEEVAQSGNADSLSYARHAWDATLGDWRRTMLKHYRDKFVAHRVEPDPDKRIPELEDLLIISGRVRFMLAQFATGAGCPVDADKLNPHSHYLSAQAFWKPWLPDHLK